MYEIIFLWALAFIWIIFAIFQDIKTKEIANWLNFSLAIFALGFRFFYSLFANDSFTFFYNGIIGLGVFFLIGNLFYYSRIFAGGDAKLIISLGAILPMSNSILLNLFDFLEFIILFLLIGAAYILLTSLFLCFKNFNKFKKEFIFQFKKNKKILKISLGVSFIFLILSFFEITFFLISLLIIFSFFLYLYSISVDEVCMVKEINPDKLREGDWLYENIKTKMGVVKSNWEGLTQKEIVKLVKNNKKVKIRQGIPFSPVFLIAMFVFLLLKFFKINLWNSFW